jgi:hypothetical protein
MVSARAQTDNNIIDNLVKHASYYRVKKAGPLMFVHMDKTVYVNNDVMWFSAYLLGVNIKNITMHQVLSAALVNNNDQKIAVQGKFVMHVGLAYGNLTVPDTVPPGHYSFVAYTNRFVNGKPEVCFVQPVTLKTATDAAFNVELVLDTLYKDPTNVRVLLKAAAKSAPLDGALINYYLGKDQKTRLSGKAKTNVIGSYTLMIPKDRITTAQHNLEVQVKSGSETKTLHLDIPIKKKTTNVQFYPEGGHLIMGMQNRVGWEVKMPGGTAIKTKGLLYAGSVVIDTIETDSFGMGMFYMEPAPHTNYTLKLLDTGTGDVYALPAALNSGVVMRIPDALVKDTLKLQLLTRYPGKITVVVHNYLQIYSATVFDASPKGRNVKIDLSTIPRGLNTITVLDSLNRPCAERLFFAHYDQKPRVAITMDNKAPGTRQKVNIKLKLNGSNGQPAKGVVSVACVQDNRYLVANDNNIEHYVYLQSELDNLPLKDDLLGSSEVDRMYLNELLLVRGWSKYKWPELMQASATDTLKMKDSLLFSGSITRFGSPLKKPVQLVLMKDSLNINTLNSDGKGSFILNNADVYTQADRKARLIVSGKSDQYEIQVTDPYLAVNKALAKDVEPVIFEEPITQSTNEFVLKGFEHATNLKEVKIRATNDRFRHGFGANSNACGDYVCRYNILNCPNHTSDPGNRAPINGEMVNVPGLGRIQYYGCADQPARAGMLSFTGVYMAKEFYGADYKFSNPTEPDYLSTICWKHGISLNSEKEIDLSFYTSDITGKFRIVVQGITNEDVVYGEDSFTVQKKTP